MIVASARTLTEAVIIAFTGVNDRLNGATVPDITEKEMEISIDRHKHPRHNLIYTKQYVINQSPYSSVRLRPDVFAL